MNIQIILLLLAALQLPSNEAKRTVLTHQEKCHSLTDIFADADLSQCIWQKEFVICIDKAKQVRTHFPVGDFIYYTLRCKQDVLASSDSKIQFKQRKNVLLEQDR